MSEEIWNSYFIDGTHVLRNKRDITNEKKLNAYERVKGLQAAASIRDGNCPGKFDFAHYKAIHKALFQEVYPFAGNARRCDMAKGNSQFCFVHQLESSAHYIFGKVQKFDEKHQKTSPTKAEFITHAAEVFADLNVLHYFREGNGRANRVFIELHAKKHGFEINLDKTQAQEAKKKEYMAASIHSMHTNNRSSLEQIFSRYCTPAPLKIQKSPRKL